MKKVDKKQFTARYNRIMYITFLVVIGISIALLIIQINEKAKYESDQFKEKFNNRSIAIDNLVQSITEHVDLMQIKAESYFLENQDLIKKSKFYQSLTQNKGKDSIYSLDIIPPPYEKKHVGNLTGKGVLKAISRPLKEELEMSLSLNSIFQAVKHNIPNSAWIYYTSKNNFINIYPWIPSKAFKFSQELYTHEFYHWGLPAKNPLKQKFWTPAYKDEYGMGIMVTAAKPVYRNDQFLGTVAIDVTVDTLVRYVSDFKANGTLMIVNEQGQLIAHPHITSKDTAVRKVEDILVNQSKNRFWVKLWSILQNNPDKASNHLSFNAGNVVIKKFNNNVCTLYKMKNAPWTITFFPHQNSLFKYLSIKEGVLISLIILFFALTIILYSSTKMTFREFISPSEKLVQHIAKENQNQRAIVPEIPAPWKPWFTTISKTFEENRNLIKMLREDKKRYMPNYLLLLDLDDQGGGSTTIGNYLASCFARTKKEANNNTVYLEYPDPRQVKKYFEFIDTKDVFKHPNGYDIWLTNNVGVVPEEVMTSLLINKMLKRYSNIVLNALIGDSLNENMRCLFDNAKVVVILVPLSCPNKIIDIVNQVRQWTNQDQTYTFTLLNRAQAASKDINYPREYDYEIPYIPGLKPVTTAKYDLPSETFKVINELVNYSERVESISVFIPTTTDINIKANTEKYVNKTKLFLGEKFGGATCRIGNGVWNSEKIGLVDEDVHIIMSYTTEKVLAENLDEVFEFVRGIKNELKQEKMAIEINKKLVLA